LSKGKRRVLPYEKTTVNIQSNLRLALREATLDLKRIDYTWDTSRLVNLALFNLINELKATPQDVLDTMFATFIESEQQAGR
jgi:hypothetical protein